MAPLARNDTRQPLHGAEHAGPPMVDASRFAPENRRRLSGPALRTFLNVADAWGLTENERLLVLGLPGRSTFFAWVARARGGQELVLPVDALLRISAVLGVHQSLTVLLGSNHEALAWLRGRHDAPVFGGQPPMALLTNGTQDAIMLVRRYLDAFRSGAFAAPVSADQDAATWSDDDIVMA